MRVTAVPLQHCLHTAVTGKVICFVLLFLYLKLVAAALGEAIFGAALAARLLPDALPIQRGRRATWLSLLCSFLSSL